MTIFLIALLVLALDQISKYWIVHWHVIGQLGYTGSLFDLYALRSFLTQSDVAVRNAIPQNGNFIVLSFTPNDAALWGIGNGNAWAVRLLLALTAIFLSLLLFFTARTRKKLPGLSRVIVGLLIGGSIGNLFDRIAFGYVRDMIYAKFIDFPIFNIADAAICIAIALLVFEAFFRKIGVFEVFEDAYRELFRLSTREEAEQIYNDYSLTREESYLTDAVFYSVGTSVSEDDARAAGAGRLRGSYIRCDGDFLPLSPVELYQYEAYKGSIHDDIRPLSQVPAACLDKEATARFLARLKSAKPRLSQLPDREILALQGLFDGQEQLPTISAVLLLADYPQRFFPQLRIIASMEDCALQQIDGTIPQMLEAALAFVRRCTQPTEEYPADAVRQLVLNALMHRDYSLYTEHLPVRLTLYRDRLEIKSPGGLYGPQSLDRLGKSQGIARNCYLALALESLGLAENRFCGIPLVRRLMDSAGLAPPVFADRGGEFTALLYRRTWAVAAAPTPALEADMHKLLAFCVQPRSREEIRLFLGLNTGFYAIAHYVRPLLERGLLRMTLPDRPRSKKQRYITVQI